MENNVTLIGSYKGIDKNKLLLEDNYNKSIIEFKISNGFKNQILQFINLNSQIGVKGYIEFDNGIVLVATKIFLLNQKLKGS